MTMITPVKFYHETTCKCCKKDDLHINTHRTDFVGHEHANKFFNVIPRKYTLPDGNKIFIEDQRKTIKDLALQLMLKQGKDFFLNEYPEQCEHLQYFDIDAHIDDNTLQEIVFNIEALTNDGVVKVLQNTESKKIHLVLNVPACTARGSIRKKAINNYICKYLYENTEELQELFTYEKWHNDIFDGGAAGIRSAFSIKVSGGEVQKRDMYIPKYLIGTDIDKMTMDEKAIIVAEYSIYARSGATWCDETIEEFDAVEEETTTVISKKSKIDNYDAVQKTIKFGAENLKVNADTINDFLQLMSPTLAGKYQWREVLINVKTAATLCADFNPHYFLHVWSAQNKECYDKDGNDDRYNRLNVDETRAGHSLTWLSKRAMHAFYANPNLTRGDMGLAEIFADYARDKIKIVSDDEDCYLWNEEKRLWTHCNKKWIGNEVSRYLEKVINDTLKKFRGLKVVSADGFIKQSNKILTRVLSYRGAMDIVAKVSPLLEDKNFITSINLNPDLIPVRGGKVVDLSTGEVSIRMSTHNYTFECPIDIDNNNDNLAAVNGFMLDICGGDEDLLHYMRVALGYCMTGHITEKAVFVWWGEKGDNGKSTLMNLMKEVLGQYCKSASKSLFIKTTTDSKLTPEREVLKDTRLAIFSETSPDDALNDEVLKMASGDDPIRVNPKYRDEFEFMSYAKLIIATNHKPKINVCDDAMVRRVKFSPFLAKFVPKPVEPYERYRDVQLVRRMKTELLDAFFTWILQGTIEWYKTGLVDIPAVMREATKEYLNENDEIAEFLADETEEDCGKFVLLRVLYQQYCTWSKSRNQDAKGLKTFSRDLEKKYKKERRTPGQCFIGIRLKTYDDRGEMTLNI